MHRLPAFLAAVPRDRGDGIIVARRRLDGGLILSHRPAADSADLPLSAIVFTHDHATGFHRRTWQRRPCDPEVDLVVAGTDRAIAHAIFYGRTILASGHPAASAALVLATGIIRLSQALALPMLMDFGLADILDWVRPSAGKGDGACPFAGDAPAVMRNTASPTALALAFERAGLSQEAGQ